MSQRSLLILFVVAGIMASARLGPCVAQDTPQKEVPVTTGTAPVATSHQPTDLHSILMESTFKIEGPGTQPNTSAFGTCFLLGEPAEDGTFRFVLVTAAHVLADISGEHAILTLRTRDAQGRYTPLPVPIPIRDKGRLLWTRHPDATIDVAVARVVMPKTANIAQVPLVPTTMLVSDEELNRLEVHPGDELLCLGYPRGVAAGSGVFPILRSGKIASYPITPTADTKVMLFDFTVFPGNSGGPVYFIETGRGMGNGIHVGTFAFVAGLVTQSVYHAQKVQGINSVMEEREALHLGVVIHARYIREAIAALPPP